MQREPESHANKMSRISLAPGTYVLFSVPLSAATVVADLSLAATTAIPLYAALALIGGVADRPSWRLAWFALAALLCVAAGLVLASTARDPSWSLRGTTLAVAALPCLWLCIRKWSRLGERGPIANPYRMRYEFAPIAMTEEDWSAAYRRIAALKTQGVTDLRAHLDRHPEIVRELAGCAVISDVNPATVATYRAPDRATLIAHFNDTSGYDGAGPTADIFKTLLCAFDRGESVVIVEGPDTRFDGTTVHLRSATMVMPGTAEPWSFVMQTVEDVSDVVAAQDDLRKALRNTQIANQAKSEFLAAMSHDMRTPLNAIIGFATIMSEESMGKLGSARYREYAGDIVDSGQHLLRLIGDLLDVSRIEAGLLPLQIEPVPIAQLARSSLRIIAGQARAAGVALEVSISDDLGTVDGDERRLRQILLNLLSNALKFTPQGGRVALMIGKRGDRIEIVVRDTGIGIDESDLARVTQPFVQSRRFLAQHQDGTGLGLALTQSLVGLHGGTMSLESRIGTGTTVTIALPLDHAPPPRSEASSLEQPDDLARDGG